MRLDTSRGIRGRRPEIDGLRAVAVIGVFLFHSWPGTFFWGWTGVDLFFVLSGFLITGILLNISGARLTASLKSFYARRVLRIWPVYYVALAGTLAYFVLRGHQVHPGSILRSLVFLQFTNLYAHYQPTTHVIAGYVPNFDHSWSVAVEEQFYVIWPVVVIGLRRRPRLLVGACLTLAVVGLGLRSAGVAPYLLLTRVDGLALGAALAILVRRDVGPAVVTRSRQTAVRLARAACCAGALISGWYVVTGYSHSSPLTPMDHSLNPLVVSGAALLFFGIVALMVLGQAPRLTAWLSRPWLVYIGGLSYAIYMFHPMVLLVVRQAVGKVGFLPGGVAAAIAAPPTLAAAHISMRYLEGPILALKARFPLREPVARAPAGEVEPEGEVAPEA